MDACSVGEASILGPPEPDDGTLVIRLRNMGGGAKLKMDALVQSGCHICAHTELELPVGSRADATEVVRA